MDKSRGDWRGGLGQVPNGVNVVRLACPYATG